MNAAHGPRLSRDNPWPGLGAFTEEDREYFHGRDGETAELVRLVRREPLTVLFGRSGLGKTSLLGAGLFPRLREDGYFPVLVRLSYAVSAPLSAQVQDALLGACATSSVEGPPPLPGATLWQFFQRANAGFWNARNRPVTPVLVLDQLEEIFTLGQEDEPSRRRSEAFLEELGDLIENRPPAAVRQALDADPEAVCGYDFQRRGCKVVLSFREDFLAEMEGLKHRIPSLMRNRYRLQPMNGAQAYEVVTASGGHLASADVARSIVGLAWRNIAQPPPDPDQYPVMEVDPALLSVICSELNLKRQRAGREHITADLLAGAEREILTDFYERAFAGLDPRVRAFVEDELITDRGYRDSFALEDALELPGVSREAIDRLVAGRLLRVDERFGVRRLELTHDVLTRVVKESRDSRKAREAEAAALARERAAAEQQRKNVRNSVFVGVGAMVAVLLLGLAGYTWHQLLEEIEATDLAISARSVRDSELDLALLLGAEATRFYGEQADGRLDLGNLILAKPRRAALVAQVDLMGLLLANSQLAAMLRTEAAQMSYAFSADSRVLAVGTADGRITLWYTDGWRRMRSWETGSAAVTALAFSRDGTRLAAAGRNFLAMWAVAEGDGPGRELARLGDVNETPVRLIFSPDSTSIAAVSARGTVDLWRTAGDRANSLQNVVYRTLRDPRESRVSCLAFGADDTLTAGVTLGKTSGSVVRWDAAAGQRLPSEAKLDDLLGFSPDCGLAAVRGKSESGSRTVRILDMREPGAPEKNALAEIEQQSVRDVRFSPDGRHLAVSEYGREGKVHVYPARNGRGGSTEAGYIEAGGRVDGLYFSPDGKVLAMALENGNVIAQDWASGKLELEAETTRRIEEVLFSPDGRMLTAVPGDGARNRLAEVWSLDRGEMLTLPDGTAHESEEVEFNHLGDTLASAAGDSAFLWDAGARTLRGQFSEFRRAEFSPDGTRVAIVRNDGAIESRDVRDSSREPADKPIAPPSDQEATSIAFSRDNRNLAIGFHDGSVALYDLNAKPPALLPQPARQHEAGETQVTFSPDGKLLASAGRDGRVVLWDAANGSKLRQVGDGPREDSSNTGMSGGEKGRDPPVLRLAFSPDGTLLASGRDDGLVVMYDVRTGRVVGHCKPREPIARVDSVVFIEGGRAMVFGAAKEGSREVCDVPGGRRLATLHIPGGLGSLALSPEQRRIALRHGDGQVTLRDWQASTLVRDACRIANRNLTCVEWRQYLGDRPYPRTCETLPAEDCR